MSGSEEESVDLVFLDSGVGGLSLLPQFRIQFPDLSTLYLADRAFFPYGEKEETILKKHLCDLCDSIVERWSPSILVLACNTASVLALDTLRLHHPKLKIVGVVPALKQNQAEVLYLLSTSQTATHSYTQNLIHSFAKNAKVHRIALPELVRAIENCAPHWDCPEIIQRVSILLDTQLPPDCPVVVLGCTHFVHIKKIISEKASHIRLIDSTQGVLKRIALLLEDHPASSSPRLFLRHWGGDPVQWQKIAQHFHLVYGGKL